MLKLILPHRATCAVALGALAVGSGMNLALPAVIREILRPERSTLLREAPYSIGALIVSLFAVQAVAFHFRSYLFGIIGQRVVNDLRATLYRALVRQSTEFFDRERVGDLVSRLSSDTVLIQDAVSVKLSVFIRYGFQVIVGIGAMLYLSPRLSSALLIMLPVLVLISLVLGKRLRKASKTQQQELARASTVAEETLGGIRVVHAYRREEFEIGRYCGANNQILQAGITRAKISAFFQSFVSFLMNVAIVLVILYGITLVNAGTIGLEDLAGFLLYGVIVAVSFAFVAGGVGEFLQATGAVDRVFELIELSPASRTPATLEPRLRTVTFAEVSFAYPSRPETPVLQNVSLTLAAGKTTALVGPSGSGKSSLVALLLDFYTPQHGTILADGVPYASYSSEQLRDRIAYVPQDPHLFGVSIAENLRYGDEHATDAALREVCAKVNLLSFIEGLPQQFATFVGERGVQLSGGQRQRLAIARALLRNPDLIILDEATSALDSENEAIVHEALRTCLRGRTVLVIAHRLATIKGADQVVVLESGSIVQQGTHESLSSQPGLYRQLVSKQELS